MAPDFKSSFIPKEPIVKKGPARRREGGINIFATIAWVIFIIAVLIAAGVFLYNILLARSLEAKKERLATEREEFDPALIEELVRLERRMETGENLLESHVAVSNVFEALEGVTSQAVRFETFRYETGAEGGSLPSLSLTGLASDFNAVAFQSDVLGDSKSFRNIIFSDVEVNSEGTVSFNISASIDPSLIRYFEQRETLPSEDPVTDEDL